MPLRHSALSAEGEKGGAEGGGVIPDEADASGAPVIADTPPPATLGRSLGGLLYGCLAVVNSVAHPRGQFTCQNPQVQTNI